MKYIRRTFSRVAKGNVFFIGLLSFFGGISQDIFVPVLPLYLTTVLGFNREFVGITEGLVTSGASLFKIVAGFLSDRVHLRKPIVFVGYFASLVGRMLLAFIASAGGILALRFLDGAGKGIKDPSKDALIADSTPRESRGRGFGVVRALDTFGSVAGPLLLFLLLYIWRDNILKYHYIFLVTAIPLLATLGILTWYVREISPVPKELSQGKIPANAPLVLPRSFYLFLVVMTLFSLGNSSDAFLILRARNVGVTLLAVPLVYALFNVVYASASIPLGSLSDRIGREKVILLGWFTYGLAYLGFAFADQSYQIWLLFAFYGIYYATTEGVAKAFVADLVPSSSRGRAYGIYNSIIGLMALPAGIIAGYLWDTFSPATPFLFGSGIALFAAVLLLLLMQFSLHNTSVVPMSEVN
ncbi:MAG: MFS transporter [Patescibacteria group bacterium]|nr:MFS transporter [Patescibacteria group bacterium]MDE2437920.1 MFS transporter [Patescibacteria group bacterium]